MTRTTLIEAKAIQPTVPANRPVYTTGEAAARSRLSQQTIIRCFDSGRIRGFRVPGSTSRRIPHEALIEFMKEHGIPVGSAEDLDFRILMVEDLSENIQAGRAAVAKQNRIGLEVTPVAWDAGFLAASQRFDLILVSARMTGIDAGQVARTLIGRMPRPRIFAMAQRYRKNEKEELTQAGIDGFLWTPLASEALLKLIPRKHLS